MGSFAFSGFAMHAFNPIMMPLYTVSSIMGNPEVILSTAIGVTALYTALGVPIAYAKWNQKRKQDKREVEIL